jgi:hypothetical protein
MKKTIEVSYEEDEGIDKLEFKGTVTLKRLNFSERNAIEEEATDVKVFGTVPQVKVSTSKIKELGILRSLDSSALIKTTYQEDKMTKALLPINTPYALDLEGIRNLPRDVGEELVEAFSSLNAVSEKKK